MRWLSFTLSILAFFAGTYAAWKWYQASAVETDQGYDYPGASPTYKVFNGKSIVDMPRFPEPPDEEQKRIHQSLALTTSMLMTSQLNKRAALLTAIALGLQTLAALL